MEQGTPGSVTELLSCSSCQRPGEPMPDGADPAHLGNIALALAKLKKCRYNLASLGS